MTDQQGPRFSVLVALGCGLLLLALVELGFVVTAPTGGGANIGLPFALIAVFAAGAATGFAAWAARPGIDPGVGGFARGLAVLALGAALVLVAFVGVGVLEDL